MIYLALRLAGWDTSVPVLRSRIPFSVLQEGLCSVYAAGWFPTVWHRHLRR